MISLRRILLVSRSMPPAPAGSAVIVGSLAQAFTRGEMVLAGRQPAGFLPTACKVSGPELIYIEGARPWLDKIPGARHLPKLMVPLLAARLSRLIRARKCTEVLGVYPDSAYWYASWLASRRTGCRFYPYFHNTYLESRRALWERKLAESQQRRIFQEATHIFVISEGIAALYRDRYGLGYQRCSALVHSFNEPIPAFKAPGMRSEPVFAFSGTANASCLEAARRLFGVIGGMPEARLNFYTRATQSELKRDGVWQPNAQTTQQDRSELPSALSSCDILLLPHGFSGPYHPIEYQTIFPTKTIEYLITGRPILAHSPPGVFLTRFLKEHACALVVEEPDPQAIRFAIAQLRSDAELRARLVRNALDTARMFHISSVAAHLREVLGTSGT